MSTLGIITVVTNEKDNLESYIRSLSVQSFKDFRLYFIDNNSSDGSWEHFCLLNHDALINTVYLRLESNYGFSGGCNVGAARAIEDGCPYLFFSNNDLEFDKDALYEMMSLITKDSYACVGPLLLKNRNEKPDEIQEFGGKIDFRRGRLTKNFENEKVIMSKIPETLETDFIGGGVCMIKSDVFKKIGMFENRYFAYFDEIDLALRLKQNGYKMIVTSKAKIWHNHAWKKKSPESHYFEYYLSQRNKYLYFRKFNFRTSILVSFCEDLIRFPFRLMWFKKVCNYKTGFYYLLGTIHGILNVKGKPKLNFIS